MPAAILGDRASGKTTFLGLLYSAQVKYGTAKKDDFRFSADPRSLKFMSAVYENMKDGYFPSATLKDEMTLIEFLFGYKRLIRGMLPQWIKEQHWMQPFSTLRFGAYDVSGEDVQEFIETGVAASPIIQQLLRSFVVVILVDCSKLTTDVDSPHYKRMLKYDSDVATLCVAFQKYKKDEYDRMDLQGLKPPAPIIYPAIVLAKFDTIRDEVLAKLGLTRGMPARKEVRARREYAEALLRAFLPQTLSQIRGGKVAGVSFDQASYFVSWVHVEKGEAGMAQVGPPRIVRKGFSADGGAAIDYSYDEFEAFIEHFRDVANKVPDEVKEADQVAASYDPRAM
ncbi:MAG TPA: hypothetical protein VGB42_11075 [Candidatus Thermoplasmatota archaeon]